MYFEVRFLCATPFNGQFSVIRLHQYCSSLDVRSSSLMLELVVVVVVIEVVLIRCRYSRLVARSASIVLG